MKKMNKKGFTLIELLAVIIILGILMIIAIPSVTTYIQNSRKSAFVDTASAYIDAVRTRVNEGKELKFFGTNTMYLVPVGHESGKSCVSVESGGQSPFSDTWNYAFVGVVYDGKGYDYYFIGEDGSTQGLALITQDVLSKEGTDKLYSARDGENGIDGTAADNLELAYAAETNQFYDGSTNHPYPDKLGGDTGVFKGYKNIVVVASGTNKCKYDASSTTTTDEEATDPSNP